MTTAITDRNAYWDHYAVGAAKTQIAPEEALKNAFGWTQYEGHGLGDELLGDPETALELGFGRGYAVAALAIKGIQATGVDLSTAHVDNARARWGHLPNARYLQVDVLDYLAGTTDQWDAIYSIFGALWFTDPEKLLPLVRQRLSSGGRLVFSHAQAVPGSYGVQGMYGGGFTGPQTWIYRWAYEPETWADLLAQHGFSHIRARHLPAPDARNVQTLLVEARPA